MNLEHYPKLPWCGQLSPELKDSIGAHLALEDRDRCGWDDDGRGRRLVVVVTAWSAHFSTLFYFFSCVLPFLSLFLLRRVFLRLCFAVLGSKCVVVRSVRGVRVSPVRVVRWPLWITAV